MATIDQVQKGFITFVDRDLSGAFEGWQKAVVIGGATLLAKNFQKIAQVYGSQPMIAALGVYNAGTGTIDIDALYDAFVPNLGASKVPITLPAIGTVKLGKEELDLLVKYIKEA